VTAQRAQHAPKEFCVIVYRSYTGFWQINP